MTKDKINPDHYKSHPSGIECIEVTRHMNFNCGNAVKYIWRNGLKDSNPSIQELKKSVWYLNDEIKRLEADEKASNQNTEFIPGYVVARSGVNAVGKKPGGATTKGGC